MAERPRPGRDGGNGGMNGKMKWNTWYFLAAAFVILMFQSWWVGSREVEEVPYSRFQELVAAGQVSEVRISTDRIEGALRAPLESGRSMFSTTRVDDDLATMLADNGVEVTGVIESNLLGTILSWVIPMALFFGVWFFLFRRIAEKQGFGGLMSVGKSKAKIYVEKNTGVTFEDVAGVDEAKAELEESVDFLRDPASHSRLGARQPKGVLLVGPPGTGKTLLARAVAGEAGVPFFSIGGSEFVEMFVGVGAARVRDLFEQARNAAPCIIFIDELDALGRARGMGGPGGGHDEKEQTLNQLLAEMDGFDPSEGVVILAATNRPEVLDPALLRAGRFDRQVLVDRPDKAGRLAILKVHVQRITLARDVELDQVASLTAGFTGADLANLVNEAALVATRRNADSVELEDFTAAIERIVAGLEKKNRVMHPFESRVVAYHEMGHALVAAALPGVDEVHKISIIPRGIGALGYTIQRPTEDRYLMTRWELENKMAVLLGGRAAERLVFDHLSTGAADDLRKATDIAREMVGRYGMDDELGQVSYEQPRQAFLGGTPDWRPREYSEATAREIDQAVRRILDAAYHQARDILERHRAHLERGAQELLKHETVEREDLDRLLAPVRPATEKTPAETNPAETNPADPTT